MKNQRFNNKKSPVKVQGASVEVRNDDVNYALRKLKKVVDNDNQQKDLSKHEYYEKPSIKKTRNKNQAKKRAQKDKLRKLLNGEVMFKKPQGTKWMKSRRKRRKVIDAYEMAKKFRR